MSKCKCRCVCRDEEDEKETKTVWLWRYRNDGHRHWKVAKSLLTQAEAQGYYGDAQIEKHQGPFEVSR